MSIKLMTAVWENKTDSLTKDETSYLVKLCDSAADNGTQVWPSRKVLVQKTRISESTQKRLDKSLTEKGYLEVISRERSNGSRTSNEYRINANKLLIDAGMEPLSEDDHPPVSLNPPPVRLTAPPGQPDRPYKQELKQEVKQKDNNAHSENERECQFLEAYEEYDRKLAKPRCRAAYKKARKDGATHLEIMQGIRAWLAFWAIKKTDKQYRPYFSRWLRDESWKVDALPSQDVPAKGNTLSDEVSAYVKSTPRMHKTAEETQEELRKRMGEPARNVDAVRVSDTLASLKKKLKREILKSNMEKGNVRNHSRGVVPTSEQGNRFGGEDLVATGCA